MAADHVSETLYNKVFYKNYVSKIFCLKAALNQVKLCVVSSLLDFYLTSSICHADIFFSFFLSLYFTPIQFKANLEMAV